MTGQANRADGLCKYCKGLPPPPTQLAYESLYPNMWHQILNFFFPNISLVHMAFQYIFFLIDPFFLTGWLFYRKLSKEKAVFPERGLT